VVIVEIVGGALSHSTGLLADAVHGFIDAAAVVLSLIAVRLAVRSPTARRTFGLHRATILTGLANASLAVAATVLIVVEAIRRIGHPVAINAPIVVVVASTALVLNLAAALVLRDRTHDLGMRAAALHMAADAGGSLGVAVAGIVILVTGQFEVLDPIVSLGIAVLVMGGAWRVSRECVEVLLESTPPDLSIDKLAESIVATPGVAEVHDIHVWSLSSDVRALSAHIVLSGHPSLEEAQRVGEQVKGAIAAPYRIAHATLELECEACVDVPAEACQFDRASVSASQS
jgi:cobalt-zinc-cadmium efflux system protein